LDIERVLSLLVAGLTSGAIYALLAMGYNVIFATTGVLNFAHGELFMLGGMIGVWFFVDQGWPVVLAMIAAVLVAAALGALEERIAVRPATSKGHSAFGWVLSTLGFAIILRSGAALLLGPEIRPFPSVFPRTRWQFGDVIVTPTQVSLVVLALVAAVALHRFYSGSTTGRALGAIAQDPEAAALRGLSVNRLSMLSFAIGSGLAALTGFFAGPITSAYPSIGFTFALKGFIAAAVGGIPEIRGALLGGLLLGVIEAFGVDLIGAGYRELVVFAVLLVMLGLRPAGIFGRESVRAV
jgi:branched-chain amino acid transport system permease protein